MSQSDEPLLRGSETLPHELRVGLERLRDKRPSAERMAAMAAAVGLTAAAGTAGAATSAAEGAPATGSGALASPLAKLLVVAGAVGVGAAALLLLRPKAAPSASAPAVTAVANGAFASITVPERDRVPPGPALADRPGAPVRPRSPADAPDAPAASPVATAPGAVVVEPPVAVLPGSVARAVAPSHAPAAPGSLPATTEPWPSERAAAPRADVAPRAPAAAPGHAPAGAAPTEAELLRGARQVLERNPLVALSLCDEHQSTYPGGKLTQERELIAIAALLRLGRTASAESRAKRFRSSYPSSPYMVRLDRLVPP